MLRISNFDGSVKKLVPSGSFDEVVARGKTKLSISDDKTVVLKMEGDFEVEDNETLQFAISSGSVITFAIPGVEPDVGHEVAPEQMHGPLLEVQVVNLTAQKWPIVFTLPALPQNMIQTIGSKEGKLLRLNSTFTNGLIRIILKKVLTYLDPESP